VNTPLFGGYGYGTELTMSVVIGTDCIGSCKSTKLNGMIDWLIDIIEVVLIVNNNIIILIVVMDIQLSKVDKLLNKTQRYWRGFEHDTYLNH
jgi:hypothetical protein